MGLTEWLLIFGFALSSSIDNFGVGVSYGVTKIKIGFLPNLLIAVIAFAFSILGIYFGGYISKIMPGTLSTVVAALFVFIIGVRIILITLSSKRRRSSNDATSRKGLQSYIQDPENADKDKSGEISLVEALVLGVAVSMNALTNGLGAGLMRLSPIYVSTSAGVFSFLAIWWGVSLGERVAHIRIGRLNLGQFSTVISGGILLLIAAHMVLTVVSI
ncbi:sporulation membrane protein YtaF [Alicyclobacillus tolerans]|uniref:sporulation membrane protein YtaF n=1 Tax=Alicyclobacillus tolerans TaxID=90970 RepID=UPI001F02419F|nr:sporulation membrane protein YtaF [Alicyclobacillus tolerans]MCF8565457.1 sporulation membrane protein YtaF [Alicyclobacillus tolerans]